jgi:competence protein ComEA
VVPLDVAALRERITQHTGVADRVRALVVPEDVAAPGVAAQHRWQPTRRAVLALSVLVVLVIVVTVAWVFSSRPQTLAVERDGAQAAPLSSASARPSASSQSTSSQAASGEVVIDVEGKVRHPGLYRLKPGDRVNDALHAAGGVLPGVSAIGLNRAAKLTDGQQIVVGATANAGASASAPATATGGDPGPAATTINLNSADLGQLEQLPGVGPVLAQHILDWRTQHGGFARIDQLQDVSGIGPSKYAALKDAVTL